MLIGNVVGKPIHKIPVGTTRLVDDKAKIGIEIEVRGWSRDPTDPEFNRYWVGKQDGSLKETGREFVTNDGLVGSTLVDALDVFAVEMGKRKWNDGYPYAGIHVHMDSTDFDVSKGHLTNFIEAYTLAEPLLFGFAGDYRRRCGFCYSLEEAQGDFPQLGPALYSKESSKILGDLLRGRRRGVAGDHGFCKYQGINLQPLNQFGTIEIRHLPTTTDMVRVTNWINMLLCLRVAAFSKDSVLDRAVTMEGLSFYKQLFPENLWLLLQPFYSEERYRRAIDTAFALKMHGFSSQTSASMEEADNMFDNYAKVNDVLRSKFDRPVVKPDVAEAPKPQAKKTPAEIFAAMNAPPQAAVRVPEGLRAQLNPELADMMERERRRVQRLREVNRQRVDTGLAPEF